MKVSWRDEMKCQVSTSCPAASFSWHLMVYLKQLVRGLLIADFLMEPPRTQQSYAVQLCCIVLCCHYPLLAPPMTPDIYWLFVTMSCTHSMLPNPVVSAFWKGRSVNAAICLKCMHQCVHPEASRRSTWRRPMICLKPRSPPMDLCWICLRRPSVRQSLP